MLQHKRARYRWHRVLVLAAFTVLACGTDMTEPKAASGTEASVGVAPAPIYPSTRLRTAKTSARALSLQRLQDRLASCLPGGCAEPDILLDGLTVLDGYLTDEADGDVILLGRAEPGRPPLHAEDLAVALRNTWRMYREGGGYSDPGCSIDPNPAVMQDLQGLAPALLADPQGSSAERWKAECRKPQKVRVLGVPFHSRFAQIMVQADYDMKSLADGSDDIEVPGFYSMGEMLLDWVRRKSPGSTSLSLMNRFWFHPGENVYEEDDGIVVIRDSPVTLLSERSYFNSAGQVAPTASRDPVAEQFAETFTVLYDEVAEVRGIYRQLENLYRFVALAKILDKRVRGTPNAKTLDFYLSGLPVAETRVEEQLPGRSHVEVFEQSFPGGMQIFVMPSCGGVSMAIDAAPERFHRTSTRTLAAVRKAALRGKAATTAASWPVQTLGSGSVNLAQSQQTRKWQRFLSEGDSVRVVHRDDDGFDLFTGLDDPQVFKWNETSELFTAIYEQSGSGRIDVNLHGLPQAKVDALKLNYRLTKARLGLDSDFRFIDQGGNTFYALPLRVEERGPTQQLSDGRFEGRITFSALVKGTLQGVAVIVRAATREIVDFVLNRIVMLVGDPLVRPMSLSDLRHRVLLEGQGAIDLDPEDVEILFQDETGKTQVVDLSGSGIGQAGARRAA